MTAATISTLTPPSEELVRHATREVEYAERLTLHEMSAGVGNSIKHIYNFPALVNTLFGMSWHRLSEEGTRASIVWVDAEKLASWIRDVLGDVEFGNAVAESLVGADHYKAQIDAMLPVFRERVHQYEAVLAPPEVEEVESVERPEEAHPA
jgi:hypothetical protein